MKYYVNTYNKFVYLNKKSIAQMRVRVPYIGRKRGLFLRKSTHPFWGKGTCFWRKGRMLFRKRKE